MRRLCEIYREIRRGCLLNRKIVLFIHLALLSPFVRVAVAEKVALDFTLTDIDGTEFSLSDYRGKVVLLDFFATYCVPCVEEMQSLNGVHEEFGEDLVIISISVDSSYDTVERLQQFREEHEIGWIIARDTLGVYENYIYTIPTLLIIDQQGYIRYVHSGTLIGVRTLSEEIRYVMSPIFLVGDINDDGRVNILDISIVAGAFNSNHGHPNWNAAADVNHDEIINVLDVALVASEFGKTNEGPFNFLLNHSVEIDEEGDSLPDHWKKGDYDDIDAVHTWLETGRMGDRSIKVSITHNNSAPGWHSAQWYQSFRIQYSPFEIGSKCRFRFWYRSSVKCYIYVVFRDDYYQSIESQETMCDIATTWTLSQWLAFTVPEGTYDMAVGFLVTNSDVAHETNAYAIGDVFELILG